MASPAPLHPSAPGTAAGPHTPGGGARLTRTNTLAGRGQSPILKHHGAGHQETAAPGRLACATERQIAWFPASGGTVGFGYAEFSGGPVNFSSAKFKGAEVQFSRSRFTGESPKPAGTSGGVVFFHGAEFSGGTVSFSRAEFSSEPVDFAGAHFSGGTVDFAGAEFPGGRVDFAGAHFSGGTVDFSRVATWTQPPDFGSGFDMSHPPAGVMPPAATSPPPGPRGTSRGPR